MALIGRQARASRGWKAVLLGVRARDETRGDGSAGGTDAEALWRGFFSSGRRRRLCPGGGVRA